MIKAKKTLNQKCIYDKIFTLKEKKKKKKKKGKGHMPT